MRGVKGPWTCCLCARPPEILENGGRGQFRLFSSLDSSPRCLIGGPSVEVGSEPVVRGAGTRRRTAAAVLFYDLQSGNSLEKFQDTGLQPSVG